MNRLLTPAPRISRSVQAVLTIAAIATLATTASALALHGMHLLPSTEAAARSTTGVSAKEKVEMPRLIHQVDPEFPASERNHGPKEYTCVVSINVDAKGMPQQVHVAHPQNDAFDSNAVRAVSQYRFKPAMQNGKPVEQSLNIAVNFRVF